MSGRRFVFDPPDRFEAIALGEPGQRAFYLRASKGRASLDVALEKVQVALLAERIGELIEELARRGVERPTAVAGGAERPAPSSGGATGPGEPTPAEPIVEAFRVGTMSLSYDGKRRSVTLDVHEIGDEIEDPAEDVAPADAAPESEDGSEDERGLLRVRMSLADALVFAEQAMTVVRAGRPPCPLCGEPLGPQGHICLRRNGYLM